MQDKNITNMEFVPYTLSWEAVGLSGPKRAFKIILTTNIL